MKWETWEKRPETVEVTSFDSTQPYDGPGQILTDDQENKYLFTKEGRRYGPLVDGDYITIRRGEVGYQKKATLEAHYRPTPQLADTGVT